jgi:putative transposase
VTFEYLLLLVTPFRAVVRDRNDLLAENLLLHQQLAVPTRPTRKRSRLRTRDKLFWALVCSVRRDWRRHLVFVRPEAVVRWHRQVWQLFWRWRSRGRLGRPPKSAS